MVGSPTGSSEAGEQGQSAREPTERLMPRGSGLSSRQTQGSSSRGVRGECSTGLGSTAFLSRWSVCENFPVLPLCSLEAQRAAMRTQSRGHRNY
ncbi:hypothetical protein NDU88_001866 [Pleurodeles waltl]|uniref:Uncharacterized protein n=1 Tax=Pleurodeles waltl TaxID=8319 RepID=A0AAV7UU21_PLEWA|nr:hypothetical protein NDU88_001866 [Pleurodeles waltl]